MLNTTKGISMDEENNIPLDDEDIIREISEDFINQVRNGRPLDDDDCYYPANDEYGGAF